MANASILPAGTPLETSASVFSLLVWWIQESSLAGQSFLNDVNRQFNAAARFVPMQDGLAEKIMVCNATYVTRFGVRLRGRMETFVGWRAVHSTHVTPAKEGIRYSPGGNRGARCTDDIQVRFDGPALRRL